VLAPFLVGLAAGTGHKRYEIRSIQYVRFSRSQQLNEKSLQRSMEPTYSSEVPLFFKSILEHKRDILSRLGTGLDIATG
jgi:hypothetical protein